MSDADLLREYNAGHTTYTELAERHGLTRGQVAGRIYRQRHGILDSAHLFRNPLEQSWVFDWSSCIIVGDVQIPTTDYDFMALPMAIGRKYLHKPRRLILAGDLINGDAFSDYESDTPTPTLEQETDAGWVFFQEYLTVFDEIYWFLGNHERRAGKRTHAAIRPKHLLRMLTHDPRVQINSRGYCVLKTPHFAHDWRVTHGKNYSVNQLVNAEKLAHKHQQNIISFHEHHLGMGHDRYKQFVLINGGGLFNYSEMAYAVMDDSSSAGMMPGFVMLQDGYPTLFGAHETFTNWDMWLGKVGKKKARAA